MLLVLAVVGFATEDWWHAEDQATTYRTGTQAAAAADWDAAAAAFGRLGSYRDAPARAGAAQVLLRRRDAAYPAGSAAVARRDWLTAYRAFSETLTIQPAYSDTQRLYTAAGAQAVAAALAGTVYRQANGAASGLYLTGAGGGPPVRLPGSDAQSGVGGYNAALGRLIYDGPRPAGPPPAGPAPTPPPGAFLRPTRQFWMAGPADRTPIALPAAFGRWGWLVPARQGAWWLGATDPPDGGPRAGNLPSGVQAALATGFWVGAVDYYNAASGVTTGWTPRTRRWRWDLRPRWVTVGDRWPGSGGGAPDPTRPADAWFSLAPGADYRARRGLLGRIECRWEGIGLCRRDRGTRRTGQSRPGLDRSPRLGAARGPAGHGRTGGQSAPGRLMGHLGARFVVPAAAGAAPDRAGPHPERL